MSFGKAKVPRFSEAKEEAPGKTILNVCNSRTSVSSQRPLKTPRTPISTQRSRSLSRSKNHDNSIMNIAETTSARQSKIPIQNDRVTTLPANNAVVKRNASPADKNKKRLLSTPRSVTPGVMSALSTAPVKTAASNKLARICPQKGVAGIKSFPTTTNKDNVSLNTKSPNKVLQSGQPKPRLESPNKRKPSPAARKATETAVTNEVKKLIKKDSSQEEEMLKDINLNLCNEKRFPEKIPHTLEVSIDLENFKSLVTLLTQESTSFCSRMIENQMIMLSNLINISIDSKKDELQDEKIENYLEEGDGLYQKYDLLKSSQYEVTEKVFSRVRDILSETFSLRGLRKDLESKVELLETENTDIMKQIKAFSEELEIEKQKTASLNQRKTQLEQQIKKYSQRVKELEDKSQNSDGQIAQQCVQLKSYETQLKQKEEKHQMLDQRFNQQAKLYRAAVDVREELEKQRDSLEARVSDLKKLKNDLQNENTKVIESLKNELNETLQALDNEKNERSNLEKEFKETHERLMQVQEKSLELANVSEISKVTIINEGSLTASEKEAKLFMKLKEVQSSLEKANIEIEHFKEENEKLRTTVFQYTEHTGKNKENNAEPSLINVLKTELSIKDETIEKLQNQIGDYLKEVEERDCRIMELRHKRDEQSTEGNKSEVSKAEEALWLEIHQLKRRLEDGKTVNENLQQQLAKKQLEVEQRERVMREQARVLQVRDELLKLLQQKDQAKTGQMSDLQTQLEDHEHNADTVCKSSSAKSEQLQELCSTLEMKQRKVMQLEEQVKQLEVQERRGQRQRTHLEAHIAELELALHEKTYLSSACIPRGSKFRFM